jgi:hypothetical protein
VYKDGGVVVHTSTREVTTLVDMYEFVGDGEVVESKGNNPV